MGNLEPSVYIIITFAMLGLIILISAVGCVYLINAVNKFSKILQSELSPLSKRISNLIEKIDTEVQLVHQNEVISKASVLMLESEQLISEARSSMSKIDAVSQEIEQLAGHSNEIVSGIQQKEIISRLAGVLDDVHRISMQVEKSVLKVNTWADTTDRAIIDMEDRLLTASKRVSDFNSVVDGVKAGFGAGVDALLHGSKVENRKKLKSGDLK